MSNQTKIIPYFYIALIMLIMILMQCACNKEDREDRDAFIKSLKGEWRISSIERTSLSGTYSQLIIQGAIDSLFYIENYWDTTIVYLNDTNLCTLPEIEKFQDWTITEKKRDLLLETRDLCGIIKNYNIEYENIRVDVDWDWTGIYFDENIKAEVKLVGMNTSISLKNFNISNGYTIGYYVTDSKYKYAYSMIR
jgi:hypothetical protein